MMSKENPTTQKRNPNKPRKMGEKIVEGVVVGRDSKVIPPEEVYKLAAIGCKDREIADWFGIDGNTLRYNFSAELIKGREMLKQSLRRAQLQVALNGNPTMLIWLGKQYLGQSEQPIDSTSNQILPWINSEEENDEETSS
jgi:hypothetical protein